MRAKMAANWQGATAVITGGGSGIGRALARRMSSLGARVMVTDLDAAAASRVAGECGPTAASAALDVRDGVAVAEIIEEVAGRHGQLDYLFNNAGIAISGETDELGEDAWRRIIDINLMGVVHGVRAAYPLMLRAGKGHIVNTASLAGLAPVPLLTPYAATKHAVVGLSTSLRIEAAARGVRVSVLCPAAVETPLLDVKETPGLPKVWTPDMRSFLTRLAGPPYPVDACAADAIKAVERNKAVIVLPARARLAWGASRLAPGLVEAMTRSAVAAARAQR